ncbi:MAG: surface antigen [Deltaproteobacteria bacterium]|nr:surface antigen [Deltaproteobacteria bacterium]
MSRHAWFVFVFGWLVGPVVACSHARTPVHRPGGEFLESIRFEGNQQLGRGELVTGLALHRTQRRGRAPDPYLVQVDADRIRGEYLRKGYLDVDVRSRVERAGDAATVIYSVEEGVRATTRVVITGIPDDPQLPVSKVRAELPLRDGAWFDYAVYDAAKQRLRTVVEDAGYAHGKLEATVSADRANHEAIIRLHYTLGPKCTFGPVEITGVQGELADAVRGRLQFAPGDRYSISAITATRNALYGLGRFSTVQVRPTETASPVVAVEVAVTESARHEVKLGGGVGVDPTAYEIRGRAGYTVVGWPFPLDTASIELQPAYAVLRAGNGREPRIRAIARLERQDLFWTYAKGAVEGGWNYLTIEAYTSYGPRARLGFSTPLGTPKLQARIGWAIEHLDFRGISPLIDPALQRNLRDNPIETRIGAYAELRAIEGTRYAGGAYRYLELVPELRGFVPLGTATLAGRLRTGVFYGDVPATERLFSGGASNHRGFGERQLSPSVTGEIEGSGRTVPYGGTAMLEASLEARIPITTWRKIGIGAVTFLDGGDVTEQRNQLDPLDLHWAVGAGLRLLTVVGPVRFDVAYRLNRTGPTEPAPGSHFAFHLTVGEAF